MNNNQEILEQLLGIDLEIEFTVLRNIKFKDSRLEDKFISNSPKKEKQQKIISDLILLGGYFICLLYLIIALRRYLFFILYLLFFFSSVIIWVVSYTTKNKNMLTILDHLQIFIFSLNLNLKAVLLAFEYDMLSPDIAGMTETEIVAELIRIIIYDFIVTNLLLLFKLEGKLITHLLFSVFNLTTIIFCQIKLKGNYYIFLDGLVGILYSIIFYAFRKLWEFKLRIVFAEKYKFENLFLYTNDFILGLNGYHLNFKDSHLMCYDEKFYKFLNENLRFEDKQINGQKEFISNKYLFDKLKRKASFPVQNQLEEKKSLKTNKNKLNKFNLFKKNNEAKNEKRFETNENEINSYLKNFDLKEINPMTFFLKQLKIYENRETRMSKVIPSSKDNSNFNNFSDFNFVSNNNNDNNNKFNNLNHKNSIPDKNQNEDKYKLNEECYYAKAKEGFESKNNLLSMINQILYERRGSNCSSKKFENIYLGVFSFEPESAKDQINELAKADLKQNSIDINIKNNSFIGDFNFEKFNSNKSFRDINTGKNTNTAAFNCENILEDENLNNYHDDCKHNKKPDNLINTPNSIDLGKAHRNYSNQASKENTCEIDRINSFDVNFKSLKNSEMYNNNDNNNNNNNSDTFLKRNSINSIKNYDNVMISSSSGGGQKIIQLMKCEKDLENKNSSSFQASKFNSDKKEKNILTIDDEKKEIKISKEIKGPGKPDIPIDSLVFSGKDLEESNVNILHEFNKANKSLFDFDNNKNQNSNKKNDSENLQSSDSNFYSNTESKHSKNPNLNRKNNKISNNNRNTNTNSNTNINNNNNDNSMLNNPNTSEIKDKIYFDVYFRKICFSEDNVIYNLILYDITDLINSKIKILEENKKKQKVLAKIAHEFKTPLTSIICLISILKDKLESAASENLLSFNNKNNNDINKSKKNSVKNNNNNNNNTNSNPNADTNGKNVLKPANNEIQILNEDVSNTLNLIQNLSRYVIFLTSDIINYSHPDNLNSIKLDFNKIDFREMSVFCFDILKSLLYCNISKLKKIKTELFYDDNLDGISYYSDQVRIKQILLNFISNSVKFTNEGFINLIFSRNADKNCIEITIKDSGSGLTEGEKKLLFKEFFKNENIKENNLNNANVGSGLGLAICKNLAEKLNMKIAIESEFGKGSEISLIIFLDNKDYESNLYSSSLNNLNSFNPNHNNINNKNRNLIGSTISKKANNMVVEGKNEENDLNSSLYENSSKNGNSLTKGKNVNIKIVNNQFNISYLDSYFQGMENNNFDVLPKKDVDNFYNQIKTERFFNEHIFDDISSKTRRSKNDLVNTVIDNRVSKRGKKDGPSLFKKAEMLNNTIIANSSINKTSRNRNHIDPFEDEQTLVDDWSIKILDPTNFERYKRLLKHESKNQLNASSLINQTITSTQKSVNENIRPLSIQNIDLPHKNIIIVADDNHIINDSNQRLITNIIKQNKLDFEVIACSDGIEILKYISDDNFFNEIKMIMTDENMEFLNGSETIRLIRTIEERKRCERKLIISLTCHEDIAIINNIKQSGADYIITKPLSAGKIAPFFAEWVQVEL